MKWRFNALMAVLLLIGCATAPSQKEEQTIVFYPSPPLQPRIQFLHGITTEEDIGKTRNALENFLIGKPEEARSIGKSYDIGSSKGKIYVMDRQYKKVLVIDLEAKRFNHLHAHRLGELRDPSGIWVTDDDHKYVADMKRKQIVVFGPQDEYVRTYGSEALFERPTDVAVYRDRVYVSDMLKNQVFVLDKASGRLIMTIGSLGIEEAHFYKPTHVVVDGRGSIFVNDAFNFRIQKFSADGAFIKSYGFLGDNIGAFARPKGLAIDHEAHLYVADAAFENVQIFDANTGSLLLFFGGPGTGPGDMYLPSGVHIDYENIPYFQQFVDKDFKLKYLLYVGNTFGRHKINVYGFGEWVGPPLAGKTTAKEVKADEAPSAQ